MGSILRTPTGLKRISLATLLAVTATPALAQNLNITGNNVTVTSGGGFNQVVNIPANGIIANLTIPTAGISGGAAVPNFAFTMGSTSVGDGSYDFSAAMMIDDDNSARRLEVLIPTITMTFSGSGTVLNGTVAAGSTVTVRGRAADGTTELSATLANSLFNFSGSTLSFTAGNQVSEIASKGGILGDIATTIAATGAYTYAVVLKQKSGSQALNFTRDGGGLIQCAPSTTFVLGSGAFASTMGGGYGLQGQFQAGAGAFGAAPTPFAATCTTNISSGGSGGGGSTTTESAVTEVGDSATDFSNNLTTNGFTTDSVSQYTAIATSATESTAAVVAGLNDGSVSTATAFSLLIAVGELSNANDALYRAAKTAEASTDEINQAWYPIVQAFRSIGNALRNAGVVPTPAQVAQLKDLATSFGVGTSSVVRNLTDSLIGTSTLSSALFSVSAITQDTLLADASRAIEEYEASMNNLLGLAGFDLDSSLNTTIRSVSQDSGAALLEYIGTEQGLSVSYTDDTSAQTLLSSNTTLLGRLLDIVGINVGNSFEVDQATTNAALVAEGVSGSFVDALTTDIAQFVKADDLSVDSGTGSATASSTLQSALSADTLTVNATTGAINYANGGSSSVVFLKSVMPAPSMIPTGTFTLPDGSSLINDGSLLYILVSGSNSIAEFAGAIHAAGAGGFSTSITDSGTIKLLETASGAVFSSTMSTSALGSATATSTTTFEAPTGDPADSAYRFVVQYDDGSRQEILPAISDAAFFQSVANAGFQVTTDRRTGIVNIGGFSFRPDFFQTPLTTDDAIYLTTNADSSGVAYRAVDANGDGTTDYQVLSAVGVQIVYGTP